MVTAGAFLVGCLAGYWLGTRGKSVAVADLNKLRADVASGVWSGKKPKDGANGE